MFALALRTRKLVGKRNESSLRRAFVFFAGNAGTCILQQHAVAAGSPCCGFPTAAMGSFPSLASLQLLLVRFVVGFSRGKACGAYSLRRVE